MSDAHPLELPESHVAMTDSPGTKKATRVASMSGSFRHDARAVVSGALAAAFVVAAFAHFFGLQGGLSQGVTLGAAAIGGIFGKVFLA